jgi:hypothetical protein
VEPCDEALSGVKWSLFLEKESKPNFGDSHKLRGDISTCTVAGTNRSFVVRDGDATLEELKCETLMVVSAPTVFGDVARVRSEVTKEVRGVVCTLDLFEGVPKELRTSVSTVDRGIANAEGGGRDALNAPVDTLGLNGALRKEELLSAPWGGLESPAALRRSMNAVWFDIIGLDESMRTEGDALPSRRRNPSVTPKS